MSEVALSGNLQGPSYKPDPLGADAVQVRGDPCDDAGAARRFGSPRGWAGTFEGNLVCTIVGGGDPDRGSAELTVTLVLRRG